MDLRSILLPLFILWSFGSLLLLFRRRVEAIWRISAFLIFLFYLLWFRADLVASYLAYMGAFNHTVVSLLHFSHQAIGFSLLLFWPLALYVAFIAGSRGLSSGLMRFLVLVTLFYWIFSLALQVTNFDPMAPLERWLPEKVHLPAVPSVEKMKSSLPKMDTMSKSLKKFEMPSMPGEKDAKKNRGR